MSWMPSPALELFERQHSVASRQQLTQWMSGAQVEGLLRRGRLVRVERGVYRPSGASLTREASALAAVLRCPDGARLTGPFVLGALGLEGFDLTDEYEVLVPRGKRPTNVTFPIREDPDESSLTARWCEIPVAPVDTCLIDAARPVFGIETGRLLSAYDSARWRRLTTTARFGDALVHVGPQDKGARRWRRLEPRGILVAESKKERLLAGWLDAFDPAPEPQVWVTPRRRVDFYWRLLRLALEYQGRGAHGHEAGRLRDLLREDELDRVGAVVLPIVAEDLVDQVLFLDWVERIAIERARQLGVPAPTRRR